MRNLKKVLALVLALVMTMSLVTIASASDFTDSDKITKTEAVDVMSAIGVLNGLETGAFNPTGTLTREQAAKIICTMLLGQENAEKLGVTSTGFSDVPATRWSAPYVAYCSSLGIVAGYGDGTFNPTGKLTGLAFGKMLLVALGFKGEYTGSNWAINVATDVVDADLDENLDIVFSAAISREDAAQMALNGLFYTESGKVDGYYFDVEGYRDIVFESRSEAMMFAAIVDSDGSEGLVATALKEHKDTTGSLADEVFDISRIDGSDDFGRPATVYTDKDNDEIAVSPKEAKAVYTTGISANDLYKLLGSKATIKATGSSVTTTSVDANKIYINGSASSSDVTVATNDKVLGGEGIITEIYKTSTANQYIVVQIQPTLAKVTSVGKTAETKTEGAYTTYTIAGNSYKVYTTVVDEDTDVNTLTINGTIAKDDYVMIYGTGTGTVDTMSYVTPATLVEGKLTAYSSKNGYTIGDNSYVKSDAKAHSGALTAAIDVAGFNTEATFALDTYGNVLGTVTVTTPNNYIFVLKADKAQYMNPDTNKVETVVEAIAITTDGSLSTVRVDADDETDLDKTTGSAQTTGLYTYTTNKDGEYVLTIAAADYAKEVTTVEKGNVELNTGLYANANTKFFVATKDDDGEKYTGVTTYTGIKNVPDLEVAANTKALDSNKDGVAEIVFMDATDVAGATADYVYVTGDYTSDGTDKVYDVYVDGELTTMKLTGVTAAGLYTVDDGAATAVEFGSGNTADVALDIDAGTDGIYGKTVKYFTYNNGLLMSSANDVDYSVLSAIDANVPVYSFQDDACTVGTAADLSATTGSMIVVAVNSAKDAVLAVYVID